jgi:hypothetical protein
MKPKSEKRDTHSRSDDSGNIRGESAMTARTLPTLAYELSATTWVAKAEVRSRQKSGRQ